MRIQNITSYKQLCVTFFITHLWNLRWKNNDNKSLLKNCIQTRPTCNTLTPLFNLQRHEAIKICELSFGSFLALADYAWKYWQTESPMSRCGKSEETAEHFFPACGLYQDIRSEDFHSMNLLDPRDCNTIVDCISHSTKADS